MLATEITDHVNQALNRLPEQYRLTLVQGLIRAFVQQVQQLEDAIFSLNAGRQLFDGNAQGAQLDGIGELVDVKRNGLEDPEYLVVILGTIAENFSDTTASVMLNIVQTVFEATSVFIKDPNSTTGISKPAQVAFGVGDPQFPTSLYPIIEQIIQSSVGAGVRVSYLSSFRATGACATAGPQAWTRQLPPGFTPTAMNPWPFGAGDLNNPYVGGLPASLVFKDPRQ